MYTMGSFDFGHVLSSLTTFSLSFFHNVAPVGEIEAETDRLTGSNKGISNIPINLRVSSPYGKDFA